MRQFIFKYCALIGFITLTTHCSTLKKTSLNLFLKSVKDQKASQVLFWSPPFPYQKQKHKQLDALWWNQQTKSSLSYFSNCSKYLQSLKDIEKDTLADVGHYKFVETKTTKDYIYSVIKIHNPNGDPTMSGMHTLKKGNCFYILNLVSDSENSFKKELPTFQKFIKRFKTQ